jgi:DNA-binding ferritin-like protein
MSKDGFKNVDAHDINFTGLLSVAIINLVDENGIDVQDLSIKDEDLLKLKKLLTGSEGDTEEIVFEGEYHNPDDAPEWFKQAKQFTPYLTGDVSVESSSEIGLIDVPTEVSDVKDVMEQVSTVMEDVVEIMEDVEEGTNNSISAGSEDWDSLLDTYESYVDKYISYMKKAANGDMSALSEYPALMEKAQELSEKIENAKDDMSSSQLKRYMEITMKMTNAVQ